MQPPRLSTPPKLWPLVPGGEFPGSYLSESDGYEHWMLDSNYDATEPTEFMREKLAAFWPSIREVSQAFKLEPPHVFFYSDRKRGDNVGFYFAGSTNDPCIALNVDTDWRGQPEQLLVTVVHELAHARLETVLGEDHLRARGRDHDEIEHAVESFARNHLDLGLDQAVALWEQDENRFVRRQELARTAVASRGRPLVVYHGTLREFDAPSALHAVDNNDFGRGIYFTSSEKDARINYAAEAPEAARKRARGLELAPSGRVIRAHLALQNPVIIGGRDQTVFRLDDGSLLKAAHALRDAVYRHEPDLGPGRGVRGGADYMVTRFEREANYSRRNGQLCARDFVDLVRCQAGLDTGDWGDPNAVNRKMEYLREAFESLGFDGIIDRTAGLRFAQRAKQHPAGNIAHLDKSVAHFVAFRPEQVHVIDHLPVPPAPRGGEEVTLKTPLAPPCVAEPEARPAKHPGPDKDSP